MIDLYKFVENEVAEMDKPYKPLKDYAAITVEHQYNILAVDSESMFLFRDGEFYWVNRLNPDFLEHCTLEDMTLVLVKSSAPFFVFRHPIPLERFDEWPMYQKELLRLENEFSQIKRGLDDNAVTLFRETVGKKYKRKERAANRVA